MDVRQYIEEHAADFFGSLSEWLAIPSISADPGHREDVGRSADWLATYLRGTGFPVAEVWPAGQSDAGGTAGGLCRVAGQRPGGTGGAGVRPP